MNFMNCGSCSGVCQTNDTGICLGCQRGFVNLPQEDSWIKSKEREEIKLQEKKEELKNAIQESSPEKSSLCNESRTSKGIRAPYSKRKKATTKAEEKC